VLGDLVVAAPLRVEARALRRGAPGLRVLRTGIGPERARAAAVRLRADDAASVAIAGLCGALDPALALGDVVLASAILGTDAELAPADDLARAVRRAGFTVHRCPIVSAEHLVRGAERESLRAGGAAAVDMESAWLQSGAGGRPLVVLRVVSDGPGRELLRPGAAADLVRALRALRRLAPALESWGANSQSRAERKRLGGES